MCHSLLMLGLQVLVLGFLIFVLQMLMIEEGKYALKEVHTLHLS